MGVLNSQTLNGECDEIYKIVYHSNTYDLQLSVAQDFLLIHGLTGNGSQWNGSAFEQLIQNEILHTAIHKPTLGGTNSSYNQAISLKTYLNNNIINNGIAIAYSMGGLNTSYYLKHEYGNQKISELYTIGSPSSTELILQTTEQKR